MKSNENSYISANPNDQKSETLIPRLQAYSMKIIEGFYFETASFLLISIYTLFIIFWLTLAYLIPGLSDTLLSYIDISFLSLFLAEIGLKIFASNFRFLFDKFNLFDVIIVCVSFSLELGGLVFKGLGVLRLVRVVVITIRKITGNQGKLRHQSKEADPLKSVL